MPAPGFLAALLGLGLGLLLSLLDVEATGCRSLGPTERLAFAPVAKARWLAPRARAPGPLDPLYGTVRRFLSVVQLNPFPEELVKSLMNEPSSVKVDEVVRYEAGYVVCAVIAGVYLLAVPTAGLCFCCCRRRRRCGGRVKTEHKALACERGALMAFLLLTTLVLLVGMVCTFVTNQRVHEQMGPSVEAVPETLLSLRGLVSDVPRELQLVGQQFALPQNRILEDLDGVGLNIGSAMHTQLRSTVYQALGSVLSLGQALQISVDHLRALNATSVELWQGQKDLEPAVQEHRERLLKLLQEPSCQGCAGALSQARALELGADFSQVPPVDNALHHLKDIPEADFSSMVEEENSTFNALPLLAAMQMADVVKDLKKVVNQQPEGLRTLAEGFPGWETASKWSQTLEEVERSSRPYLKELQRYEKYRGVGLSFLFAAPLILLVFATFLVGGNMQTLVCRSWESGDLYKFADTPGNLPSSMNLTQLLDLKENVSIFLAYRQCKEGAVLWKVLQLNDSFDLEKHLDISQYTSKLHQDLQNLKVDMEKLDLLNSASRRDLKALQRSGLENIHYPGFLVQIEKPVVNTELEKLTQELERLTQTQSNSVLREQLQEEAHGLRKLHQQKVLPQQNLVAKLNFSVRTLASSAPNLQLETSGTLNKVDYLKGELLAQANQILRNESECFLDREMGYFSQYMAWVREEVTQRIATCQPLSGALDNGRVILCDMMTDPWNAFWFCLAWCTFFLIPSIIFAVKTSKYFRPIRKRLSSTSSEETQLFHIPRVTSLKL
ncbi:prominin-2 isoform X2 [Erinaceus europaeus]|uniref:Prominin-2 isoform X2 n=1 Tax=Erinaceus europaeus TaxID=9365 RepID=A0ABM3X385_ERIEU|nr:prominin-2 isoform X2 [Erinaceus europaeus]